MALLFVQEEESPVLPNGPADPTPVAVIPPFRIFNGPFVAEPVVGVQLVILVVPITGAVQSFVPRRVTICTGRQVTGKVHTAVVRLHPELFQAFYGSGTTARGVAWKPVL